MKYLWCLLLCAGCSPIPDALSRNVTVTTTEWMGSGVVIKTNHVLTNYHVVKDGRGLKVNNYKSQVLAFDEKHDLALLKSVTAEFRQIQTAYPYVGEPVFYVGDPGGHINSVSKGSVVYTDFEETVTNTVPMGGMSGGGLYDYHGRLVGLNAGMEGDDGGYHVAIHIPIEIVNRFLQENLK